MYCSVGELLLEEDNSSADRSNLKFRQRPGSLCGQHKQLALTGHWRLQMGAIECVKDAAVIIKRMRVRKYISPNTRAQCHAILTNRVARQTGFPAQCRCVHGLAAT